MEDAGRCVAKLVGHRFRTMPRGPSQWCGEFATLL
jgi:hypothetical protein